MSKKKSTAFSWRKLTYCNYTYQLKTSNGLDKLMQEYEMLERECTVQKNIKFILRKEILY